jgi:predicted GIY-YIG superfamily endonuclease
MARKRRVDRNHIVYMITCKATGERYIGITVAIGRAYLKSIDARWERHIYHTFVENRNCILQQKIKYYGVEGFTKTLITVVRGKKAAHELEKKLVLEQNPELNTALKN